MKLKYLVPILLIVLVLVTALYFSLSKKVTQSLTLPNKQTVQIEIADNPATQAKGLMFRRELAKNSGMLFVFDRKAKHIFWMKNTLIPLDMIWMDENMQIVDITYNAQPCENNSKCQTYMPSQQAKYVLEVTAGFSEINALRIGDKLTN